MRPELESLVPLLQVFDMPTSVRFYRDLLGFEVVEASPPRALDDSDWVWLRRGGMDLMLNTAYDFDERPAALPRDRYQAHRDTGLFFGCRELDAAYRFFASQGIELEEPRVAPYGMRQLWLHDPDGYVLCLQWPAA